MSTPSRTRRAAVAGAWVTAGAVGATALTGVAVAAGPHALSATGRSVSVAADDDTSRATSPERRLRQRLSGLLHGEFTIDGRDGVSTVAVQRGAVTAASATSLSVRSSDGFTATYALSSATTIRRDRATVPGDALQVGDTVLVRGGGGSAATVRALSPETLARLKARMSSRATGSAGSGTSGSGLFDGLGA